MNITLRQLRAFVEVIKSEGFTAGARKLHLTQSATSLLVRELESQLGLPLVDRTTRQIALTDAGRELFESAERILADVEHAVANTQDLLHKRRGRVTVATTPFLAAHFLPGVIAQFQVSHPAVSVRIADLPTEQLVRAVDHGDADIGFGVFPQMDVAMERAILLRHSLGVLLPAAWPLAQRRRRMVWADLEGQPMIGLAPAGGFRALVDPLVSQGGETAALRFEVGHLGTAVGLVEAGLGATVVPAYVGALVRSTRTRFRELHDPVIHRNVELVWRASRSLSPSASAFRACLEGCCKQLQA
ncbi:transcriptional regulator [Acidovorax sp. CF316]|uniref:LysR family transcriptional regulator n=1 Tax=Acidovorax sp. CF316 TaxID=1144317 RepID=UPI00026BC3ED|nr:LysR substrate-binding domain-containing protein [Acidovorax sp. CF316]EJE49632.1 transcriptional regulator [Acidovorax sp. CF316]